ncbi:hypothetical protein SBRCBS47491_005136 [Sporothrix bragantina]|uniref:Uncharacterized protein n=1 Tax=Sporothrix bragantina TaxID=671064 RepID=A0ABP0BUH6_9PEZI
MEYLGYVAANNPPPNYYLRRPPPQPPQRSNSTKVVSSTNKSRFSGGHRRTNSNDSSQSHSSHEITYLPFPGATTSAAHDRLHTLSASPVAGDQPPNRQQQQQHAVLTSDRNKELPPPPTPLAEGLNRGPRLSSLPSTPLGENGAPLRSTPARLSSPSGTAGSRRRTVEPVTTDTATKRKIRKRRRLPGEKVHIEATEQLQDTWSSRLQEADKHNESDLSQDGRHHQRGTQHYSQERDYDRESGSVLELGHEKEPSYQQDHERELDLHNYRQQSIQQHIQQQQQQQRQQHQQANYVSIVPVPTALFSKTIAKPSTRNENVSGALGSTTVTSKNMLSSEPPSSADGGESSSQSLLSMASNQAKPFVVRNGHVSLTVRSDMYQLVFAECIRLLQPGGTLEVWDSDHAIRLLRPHLPTAPPSLSPDEEDDYDSAMSAGAYVLTPNTPFSAPLNTYIVDYNAWLVKALESRSLPSAQCALVGALFFQEAESLTNVSSRRLVVPLSEMRWEREGVGGVVTKDGKTYIETKGMPKANGKTREVEQGKKTITPAQSALRRTALLTVVQLIQSLEPILREVSGKSQDEWDGWSGKMMNDLMKDNGTFWGECLEVGAWWAQKR